MTASELLSEETFSRIFDIADEITKTRCLITLEERAEFLGCKKAARTLIAAYRSEEAKVFEQIPQRKIDFPLEYTRSGQIRKTINNFERIIQNDPYFEGLRLNELTGSIEVMQDGQARLWTDSDDNLAFSYIEREYKIQSTPFCLTAIANVARSRSYQPIHKHIEAAPWDGVPRIENFLCFALECDDTPYVREVSRLIFAGGIHRAYDPGCKFDNVPVLIGENQGEGKSSVVQWLAVDKRLYAEIFTIEGKDAMEMIGSKWICELSELMALKNARDSETVKSFFSREVDHFRKSYDRRPNDYPRQCLFVGTTNDTQFLVDKTGNRRFLPVEVHSNGYEVHRREQEIRAYIRQCWAEAKALYDRGEIPPYPNPALKAEIEAAQYAATEEDYRVGLIEEYLYGRDVVCVLELWKYALGNEYSKPSRWESDNIVKIMGKQQEWRRVSKGKRFTEFGHQRYWKRESTT